MPALVLLAATAPPIAAQEEEGPGARVVTVTSFEVPFADRGTVIPFMVERFLPGMQLNPNAINVRVLFHNWGGNAADMAIVAEYASFEDIESDCGQPCDDYYDANPPPEEGTPEREEFNKAAALWSKYYSHHRDEIYVTPMGMAKVEGVMMGPVGGEADEEEGGN
jgi:hypothetical protein